MRYIPPSLLAKIQKANQTLYENADPRMSIAIARARSSITDSTYFTVETIRTKAGLGDISLAVRRQVPYGCPDRIYEIHIDNGIAKTAYREYPDRLKAGWKDAFTLEVAISVATAFNGHWGMNSRKQWQLVTEETPYLFWIDGSNNLWCQKWGDVSSRVQLADGAVKVAAIRGWKDAQGSAVDQGIVCAYIKSDGKINYRNYCQQADSTFIWESERQITEFTEVAVNIGLFRTNDYRLGFLVESSSGQVSWVLTTRAWSSMATLPENLSVGLTDLVIHVIPISYFNTKNDENMSIGLSNFYIGCAIPISPIITSVTNLKSDTTHMAIKFSNAIYEDLAGKQFAFTLKDSLGTIFQVIGTAEGKDQTEMVLAVSNFASAKNPMTLTYSGGTNLNNLIPLLTVLKDNVHFEISNGDISFTANIQPPIGYATENLGACLSGLSIVATKVNYLSMYESENIGAGLTGLSVVVTKVGSAPL